MNNSIEQKNAGTKLLQALIVSATILTSTVTNAQGKIDFFDVDWRNSPPSNPTPIESFTEYSNLSFICRYDQETEKMIESKVSKLEKINAKGGLLAKAIGPSRVDFLRDNDGEYIHNKAFTYSLKINGQSILSGNTFNASNVGINGKHSNELTYFASLKSFSFDHQRGGIEGGKPAAHFNGQPGILLVEFGNDLRNLIFESSKNIDKTKEGSNNVELEVYFDSKLVSKGSIVFNKKTELSGTYCTGKIMASQVKEPQVADQVKAMFESAFADQIEQGLKIVGDYNRDQSWKIVRTNLDEIVSKDKGHIFIVVDKNGSYWKCICDYKKDYLGGGQYSEEITLIGVWRTVAISKDCADLMVKKYGPKML